MVQALDVARDRRVRRLLTGFAFLLAAGMAFVLFMFVFISAMELLV